MNGSGNKKGISGWLSVLGPGLLYAGAAVGVSHLVQSTRAGAGFGFSLIWVVILANIIKYPFFEAGPRYAAATGTTLVEGYRRLGWLPLIVFILFTLGTMLAVQAAVTVVTAGLAGYSLGAMGLDTILVGDFDLGRVLWGKSLNEAGEWVISPWKLSARLLVVCGLILAIGRYKVLDKIMKVVVVLLSVTTLMALIFLLVGGIPAKTGVAVPFDWGDSAAIVAVVVPLVGWMPAPIDIAIWHSVWSIEKAKTDDKAVRLKDALLDFGTGYWGTTVLAICFLAVGALVMFGSGQPIETSAGAFSRQLIEMYTAALGDWARPVIAFAALTTMFSTTLTCLDAFPRVLKRATELFVPSSPRLERSNMIYWIWIVIVAGGASYVLANHMKNLLSIVDIATTLSFLTAPFLALFNFMAVTGKDMPSEARPGRRLRIHSYIGLVFLFGFAVYYFWVRFG